MATKEETKEVKELDLTALVVGRIIKNSGERTSRPELLAQIENELEQIIFKCSDRMETMKLPRITGKEAHQLLENLKN